MPSQNKCTASLRCGDPSQDPKTRQTRYCRVFTRIDFSKYAVDRVETYLVPPLSDKFDVGLKHYVGRYLASREHKVRLIRE